MSHTPGPWLRDWCYDAERAEADCGVYTEGRSIGLGHAYAVARCPRYQSQERWEADGRLIAASPDLLAALEKIEAEIKEGTARVRSSVAVQVRAAIAKAGKP